MKRPALLALVLGLFALAACDEMQPNGTTTAPNQPPQMSRESAGLRDYYQRIERDLVARGLLRTDGGGPDTPFTAAMLARNFEQIAFYDEYARGGGLQKSNGRAGQLRRWSGPVRIGLEFGNSVPQSVRSADGATVSSYVRRLAGVTGHSITMNASRANFHVLVMGADDREQTAARIRQLIPGANTSTMALFTDPPRTIHCLVVAYSSQSNGNDYRQAVALVRAEHPDLLRKACYHEEIAQGLGLANDSPEARPSIFNDDDEFALLTTHDEALLSMLYDKRLQIGMTLEQARPVVQILAREKAGSLY